MASSSRSLTLSYINIHGQTGLNISKQVQIETFLKTYNIDIAHCQEINIDNDSFQDCPFINSSYNIISNNASNKYGTCSLVSSTLQPDNIKFDTNGRVITFNIEDITFGNIYLPSGNDPFMKNSRENYAAETIPQLLINCKDSGCIGGDWNSIIHARDATKNTAQKMSASLKRLVKTFAWNDSFRSLHPLAETFSRYYESQHGEGATRIDREYHWGDMVILEARYVGIAFSDHLALVITVRLPEQFSRLMCPRSRPQFKAKPEVVRDQLFQQRLKEKFSNWSEVKDSGLDILSWWELIVKPGLKKLLIQRGKELNKEKSGHLNLLLLKQAYFVLKIQRGDKNHLADLKQVQTEIQEWYRKDCEKIKLQARTEEVNSSENVRIYHHELHAKHIKRSAILKLETDKGTLEGHDACAKYLENAVGDLLLHPAALDVAAQNALLREVRPVFTAKDNEMLIKEPSKEEVKESVWSANIHAAPGNDGLTNLVYKECWDILGDPLSEVAKAVLGGRSPTLSQRTSLMVYGNKANKPPNSPDPKHKRRISLLNSDFKVISGIPNQRLKKVATHTLNQNQLSAGDDRRIHHGINKARDAIFMANSRNEGAGILDNDYMSAFDFMVLTWVFQVLEAKGADKKFINTLKNMYDNHLTVVVVNNVQGKCFKNHRWSIRQGDRPSSLLFCFGLDPHLDWLEKRLTGIHIYNDIFSSSPPEIYKLIAYVDDVKPSITSMQEFSLVDYGSSLFEAASGCHLHRDPASGKVKFLPLGRWKGTLTIEDLPVKYVALSDPLTWWVSS